MMKDQELTIGTVARQAGVNVETIRFYHRRGLLPEPQKPLGGVRRYTEGDVARVRFIKSAQRLGFTLDEIGLLLRLDDGTHCAEAREIAEHKLADVRAKLNDLRRIEAALQGLVEACQAQESKVSCPLIASLRIC
ncbi:MAG: Hg(II)-responsive transcriptional regulator [Sulfuricella sp.]